MDIPAVSMALSQSNIQQQAGLSVMKMAMGVEKANGDAITSLASQTTPAIHPFLGVQVDIQAYSHYPQSLPRRLGVAFLITRR